MDETDLEFVAATACDDSGLDDRPRCDPRTMAVSYLGLTLAPWPRAKPRLVRGVVFYPDDVTEDAQAYFVAHEVGHVLLEGERLSGPLLERAASRVGSGVLLPRKAYLRDLCAVGLDVPALRALWPLASPWVHARRVVEVRGGGASRWRRGRACERVGATATGERALAVAAAERGAASDGPAHRAWRVGDDVIVVRC